MKKRRFFVLEMNRDEDNISENISERVVFEIYERLDKTLVLHTTVCPTAKFTKVNHYMVFTISDGRKHWQKLMSENPKFTRNHVMEAELNASFRFRPRVSSTSISSKATTFN